MESASLYLPKAEILEILCPQYFKGTEAWSIYPANIYDFYESPEEISYFFLEFLADKNKNMKALFSPIGLCLNALVFRPHLMNENDFNALKEAMELFDDNDLCFKCGFRISP